MSASCSRGRTSVWGGERQGASGRGSKECEVTATSASQARMAWALRQALLPHPTGGPPLSPSTASHSQVDSDMAVCEDLWELLEDADGEWLVLRPEVPTSRAFKCC